MDEPWPHEAVVRDIRSIMGTERGSQAPPLKKIAQCREHLGSAIINKLRLFTPEPCLLDKLVGEVLRAALEAAGPEDPQIMSARELLGFTLRTHADIEIILKDSLSEVSDGA